MLAETPERSTAVSSHSPTRIGLVGITKKPAPRWTFWPHWVRGSGYYEELRLQAFAAAEHARSPSAEATDWHAIAGIYSRLELLTRSPVVRLNRAVAVAEATSAELVEAVEQLQSVLLPASHRLAAIRAELYHRCGDKVAARNHFEVARDRCANDAERAFLSQQIAALD